MALGHLVMSCGNLVFIDLIEHLLTELGRNDSMSTTRTYIQCTAAISRQAGHRIGEYLEKIIPLVVKFCNVDDDELREYCIQAFESFVRRYRRRTAAVLQGGVCHSLCLPAGVPRKSTPTCPPSSPSACAT